MKYRNLFSLALLLGITAFAVGFSAEVRAVTPSDYLCDVNYSGSGVVGGLDSCCYPIGSDNEPYRGVSCRNEGLYLQELGQDRAVVCTDAATLLGIASSQRSLNRKAFNCFNGATPSACRDGYCDDNGVCKQSGAVCPSANNRVSLCPSGCGPCETGHVYCPGPGFDTPTDPGIDPGPDFSGAPVCRLIDYGPGGGIQSESDSGSCRSQGRDLANPCTGECTDCAAGFTLSGRSLGMCIPFAQRFIEIYQDGLTPIGGKRLTFEGILHENTYLYGKTGDPVSADATRPEFFGSLLLEADSSDHLDWSSSTIPGPLAGLISGRYQFCDTAADCPATGTPVCKSGLCYNAAAGIGDSCTIDSNCDVGLICSGAGICVDILKPCSSDAECDAGLVCKGNYCVPPDGGPFTEDDPQVDALDPGQWCVADATGTKIDCDQPSPAGGADSDWNETISPGNVVRNTGNVGVGTPAPTFKFHTVGNARITGSTAIGATAVASGLSSVAMAGGNASGTSSAAISGGNSSGPNSVAIAGGISSAANSVAIGASTASGAAAIAAGSGAIASASGSVALGRNVTVAPSASGSVAIGVAPSGASTVTDSNVVAIVGGPVGIGNVDPGSNPNYIMEVGSAAGAGEFLNIRDQLCIRGVCRTNWPAGGPGGGDTDWIEVGPDVHKVVGNVGIGTATPTVPLDVSGDVVVGGTPPTPEHVTDGSGPKSAALPRCSCDADNRIMDCPQPTFPSGANPATCYDHFEDIASGQTWSVAYTANAFEPASLSVVTASNRVGIGTLNPASALHVEGRIRVGDADPSINRYMQMGPSSSFWTNFETDTNAFYFNKEVRVSSGLLGSYNNQDLRLTTGGIPRISADHSTGNVAVGTNATPDPSHKLEVLGDINATGQLCIGDDCRDWQVGDITTPGKWCTTDGNVINCTDDAPAGGLSGSGTVNRVAMFTPDGDTLGNSPIYTNTNGNVGIGIFVPSATLELRKARPLCGFVPWPPCPPNSKLFEASYQPSALGPVDSHFNVWTDGRVGVGEDTPDARFHVDLESGSDDIFLVTKSDSELVEVENDGDFLVHGGAFRTYTAVYPAEDGHLFPRCTACDGTNIAFDCGDSFNVPISSSLPTTCYDHGRTFTAGPPCEDGCENDPWIGQWINISTRLVASPVPQPLLKVEQVTQRAGINTESPQYTLDVNGDGHFAGSLLTSSLSATSLSATSLDLGTNNGRKFTVYDNSGGTNYYGIGVVADENGFTNDHMDFYAGATSLTETPHLSLYNKTGMFLNGGALFSVPVQTPYLNLVGASRIRATSSPFGNTFPNEVSCVNGSQSDPGGRQILHEDDGFCFLSKVEMRELDSNNEYGRCEITKDGAGFWVLNAQCRGSDDNDVYCKATCITWATGL